QATPTNGGAAPSAPPTPRPAAPPAPPVANAVAAAFATAPAPAKPAAPAAAVAVQRPAPAVSPKPTTGGTADEQKLKLDIARLENLVKKLQSELEAEREYSKALEEHVKTLQENDYGFAAHGRGWTPIASVRPNNSSVFSRNAL